MQKEAGIRGVSFDVGGTLIEPWPSVGHVYAAVADEFGYGPLDPDWLTAQFTSIWRAQTQFNYTRAEWADLVVRTCGGSAAEIGLATPFFDRLYSVFTEARVWRVHEDVRPTLQGLRQAGVKLAVISNWDDRLRLILRNLDLHGFFDTIEVSGESGHHKPSSEIFRRAVVSLGLPPGAVLHVGDSFREDFEGARNAGMAALWLRRLTIIAGPEQIASLGEILKLVM